MSLLTAADALACAGPNYTPYDFSPFRIIEAKTADSESGSTKSQDETCSFWAAYTKGALTRDQIESYFKEVDFHNFRFETSRPLYVYLSKNNDLTALQYIHDCMEFNQLSANFQDSGWEYEERNPAALRAFARRIAARKGGKTFGNRYDLLRMRVAAVLHDDAEIMKIWNSVGKKMSPSALRDRMGGFVGGVLYRQKKYPEALDYFYASGDNNSISWCVSKLAGADNLSALYDHAPNSNATLYVLQDYLNYLISATKAGRVTDFSGDEYEYDYSDYGLKPEEAAAQRESFIQLCDRVLADSRCRDKMAWATAKGALLCTCGRPDEALSTLRAGRELDGDDTAAVNRDHMEAWALLLLSGKGNHSADKDFIESLTRIYSTAETESRKLSHDYTNPYSYWDFDEDRMPAYEFLTTFLAEEAITHYSNMRQYARALGIMAMIDDLPISPGYDNTFMQRLRDNIFSDLTEAQALTFFSLCEGKCDNPVDECLHPYAAKYSNLANDAFGTRLLRQSRFEEALKYLEKIDNKWFITQASYPFLNRYSRYVSPYYEFRRTRTDDGVWSPYRPHNTKAEYCTDMIQALKDYDTLKGNEKGAKAWEIAALYHMGSPAGDCWAISDYAWSVCEPMNEFNDASYAWLLKGLKNSTDPKTMSRIYYALLASPTRGEDSDTPVYAIGVSAPYDGPVQYYWNDKSKIATDAMNYLMAHQDILADDYTMSNCDVLKDYAAGDFIAKPTSRW